MKNIENFLNRADINSLNFETLFKFCPDGIVCKDSQLCYLEANESYNSTFAFSNFDSIVGRKDNPYLSENIKKLIYDADNEAKISCKPINYVINLKTDILTNVTTFPIIHNNIFLCF